MKGEHLRGVLWDMGLLQDTQLPVASAAAGAGRAQLNVLRQAGECWLSS